MSKLQISTVICVLFQNVYSLREQDTSFCISLDPAIQDYYTKVTKYRSEVEKMTSENLISYVRRKYHGGRVERTGVVCAVPFLS